MKKQNEKIEVLSKVCELTLHYSQKVKSSEMPLINTSTGARDLLKPLFNDNLNFREQFIIMCLSRSNRVLGFANISIGGVNGTIADPKLIFEFALSCNASSVILSHNHPSGNEKPSDTDLKLTTKIKDAGKCLDIAVLDHLIITDENYFSFADEGHI
jgi:DNA repair protein RadC